MNLITKGFLILSALLIFNAEAKSQTPKILAPTPPMGWNSWNWFGKKAINEEIVKEVIDAIVNEGLKDAGYVYVVVDGGWRDTVLGPNGELRANPEKFPHGMKALADYAHSKGLKFGLHTVPGTNDCGGDPVGGFGHESVQVQQFVDWGLDFIKLDKCKYSGDWNEDLLKNTYEKWNRLLKTCGRDIVLSISAYKYRNWYPGICSMARTTGDIRSLQSGGAIFDNGNPHSVMKIAEINNRSAQYAGNGYWNDPDMVITGNQGLNQEEQKTHFALWCIMSAPLMLGDDPRHLSEAEKSIILNPDCIAIDQDPTEQGKRIKSEDGAEIWLKNLKNGEKAVLLLNRDDQNEKTINLDLNNARLPGNVEIKDVYAKKELGSFNGTFSQKLKPHACKFLLIK